MTIGVDVLTKTVSHNGQDVRSVWYDCSGQAKYRQMIKGYMAQIDIFCLLVDLSNKEGLANLRYWVAMIEANAGISPYILIIGNKCDRKALSY